MIGRFARLAIRTVGVIVAVAVDARAILRSLRSI
jgi:hypothetical protein